MLGEQRREFVNFVTQIVDLAKINIAPQIAVKVNIKIVVVLVMLCS